MMVSSARAGLAAHKISKAMADNNILSTSKLNPSLLSSPCIAQKNHKAERTPVNYPEYSTCLIFPPPRVASGLPCPPYRTQGNPFRRFSVDLLALEIKQPRC